MDDVDGKCMGVEGAGEPVEGPAGVPGRLVESWCSAADRNGREEGPAIE